MINRDIVQQRRLVYSALARHIKQDRLLEALWLWEQKYALTGNLELRKFVTEITTEDDPPELKSNMFKTLAKATYFPGEVDLLPDPYDAMQQYRQQCNGTFKYISPFDHQIATPFATVVFQRMLETMLIQIKRENNVAHENIMRQIMSHLLQQKLETTRKDELSKWLHRKIDSLQLLYPESFMSSFLNTLYITCCEYFGPVLTDKMLAKTINDADNLEEAKFFKPTRLL